MKIKIFFLAACLLILFSAGKLNSQQWSSFGEGLDFPVNSIILHSGSFYAASDLVYILSGDQWSAVDEGMYTTAPEIYSFGVYNGDLFAGGAGFFVTTPDLNWYNFVGRLHNGSWTTCGSGTGNDGSGMNSYVNYIVEYNGYLYAGGNFTTAGGDPLNPIIASYIAGFDGTQWSPVGSGMNDRVTDMVVYNGELVVSGYFTNAGGLNANYIAKWNGSTWSTLGSGMDGKVTALAVYNSELYAGGLFENAGGAEAKNIAKWNGSSWSPVGGGITEQVYTLVSYNNELYAGGAFRTLTGNAGDYIMSWDGAQWKAAGSGTDGNVIVLYPDASGLIVGGSFATAGGISANNIAKFFTITEVDDKSAAPAEFYLLQNYPNPFNPSTKIKFTVPAIERGPASSLQVTLKIYNILGKEIATLVNELKEPGIYEAEFNSEQNPELTSGVYFYKLTAGSVTRTRKMIFMK
jgi:trimeric autotransporter adhesin